MPWRSVRVLLTDLRIRSGPAADCPLIAAFHTMNVAFNAVVEGVRRTNSDQIRGALPGVQCWTGVGPIVYLYRLPQKGRGNSSGTLVCGASHISKIVRCLLRCELFERITKAKRDIKKCVEDLNDCVAIRCPRAFRTITDEDFDLQCGFA